MGTSSEANLEPHLESLKATGGLGPYIIPPVNGRELVADDIVYSYNRVRDLKLYAGQLQNVTRIEAVDKGTLKLTLDKPNADLLQNLAYSSMVIVAKEAVDQSGDLKNGPTISTGPWIFEDFKAGDHFFAKRNPDYFLKGLPYADRFESYRTADAATQINAFRAKQLNVLGQGVTNQQLEDLLKTRPDAKAIWVPRDINPVEIGFKLSLDNFKDPRVRQAISKALDRKAMIDTIFGGHARYT